MHKRVVRSPELDADFKFEVAKTPEGKTVLWCVQCGMCSSSCPFSESLEVKPHEVVKMTLLGMRGEVLSQKKIWACATCYMCAERCPQGIELGNVLMALANIAAKEEGVPKGLCTVAETLFEEGRVVKPSRMRIKEREKLALPPIPDPGVTQTRKILEQTGITQLIKRRDEV